MAGPFPQSSFWLAIADDDGAGAPDTYTEHRTAIVSVSVSGGEKTTGMVTVAGRDKPYVGFGKKQPITATLRILYTDGATDLAKLVKSKWDADTKVWLRLVPYNNDSATDTGIQMGPGFFTQVQVPEFDSASGDPITLEASVYMDGWDYITVDTSAF